MTDKTVRYTPEFKRQMAALHRAGGQRSISLEGIRSFGLDDWIVAQACRSS